MQLVESNWNVVAIWHAHRDDKRLPAAGRHEQPGTIGVWRRDYKTYFRTLDQDEAWLWRTLVDGTGFSAACAQFAATLGVDDASAAQRAAQLLRSWVDDGWIQAFDMVADD